MRFLVPLIWLVLAADTAADRSAQLETAMVLLESGQTREAARILKPLAQDGSAVAETALGLIVADQQPAVATAHFFRAAQRGYPPAQLMLARALAEGAGTPVNRAEALRWALVAERQGQGDVRIRAGDFAARLMRGMDSTTVARARDRAAAWRPWAAMPG